MIFIAMLVFFLGVVGIFKLTDRLTRTKSSYQQWLKDELLRNPDYIIWLKYANNGKDYKLGLQILNKIKKR